MNPRRFLRMLVVLLLCASPAAARADDVDTILRRAPADDAPTADLVLGPTRAQGDFAEHLDDILALAGDTAPADSAGMASAAPDSSAPTRSILALHTAAPAIRKPSILLPVLGGVAGGLLGLYGGGFGGILASGDGEDEWVFGALVGAFAGETILLPLGVHLGNGSHGSFLGDLGLSLVTGLAGVGMIGLAGTAGFAVGVAAQLAAVVANERATARRHLGQAEARRNP